MCSTVRSSKAGLATTVDARLTNASRLTASHAAASQPAQKGLEHPVGN